MQAEFNILITNDDGYDAKGLGELVEMMRPYGKITVVAPKKHQSGMATAVSLGDKAIGVKCLRKDPGESWYYVDATPASCVKFALDKIFPDRKCDLVLCGINHGSNAAVATNYSGTMGAAEEGAINGIPSIGVSLCEYGDDADFSQVRKFFPKVLEKLLNNLPERRGISYNVNFPPSEVGIRGVRICKEGYGYWVEEYEPYVASGPFVTDDGESLYVMRGRFEDGTPVEDELADHHAIGNGFISVTPQTYDRTDHEEVSRLKDTFDEDF